LAGLIEWAPIEHHLADATTKGEPAWPPMALFAALLIAVCYDFPEVKLAEVLDNWASFRRFCGSARTRGLGPAGRRVSGSTNREVDTRARSVFPQLLVRALVVTLTAI
jgi:hypothetical protein